MISKAVQTLLDRMNEFPNEFVDPEFNMANDTFCTVWERTRWAGATKQMLEDDDHNVFTNEERECYLMRLRAIVRAKFDEDVCRALLEIKEKHEFMQKQMELPFGKHSLTEHLQEHLRAVGLPPTLIKDSTS